MEKGEPSYTVGGNASWYSHNLFTILIQHMEQKVHVDSNVQTRQKPHIQYQLLDHLKSLYAITLTHVVFM